MSNGFTKIYREERELLWQTNSIAAYEVYMHLKDKYSDFKDDCYDLEKCISNYLDIPQRTIKDAIKRLKTVGLVTVTKRGKVNVYGFPIVDKLEGKVKEEDMGMCLGTIEEIENKTIERQPDTEYVVKEEIQPENDNFSDTTYDFLDEYELIVKNCISTLASSDNEIWKKSAKRKLINTLEDAGIENGSREFEEVHKYVQLMVEYTIRMENEYKEILTA
jgi:hypothetical protein